MENSVTYEQYSAKLFEIMKRINPGIGDLELYEFRYGLDNLTPSEGWDKIKTVPSGELEQLVNDLQFYKSIKIKPSVDNRIVLDEQILSLTRTLLAGLYSGEYSDEWINRHFYFDIRGFYFLHRSEYFTDSVKSHFGGKPYREFERKQDNLEMFQDLGYKAFREANADIDRLFTEMIMQLVDIKEAPVLIAIAGPTAAGKTEIASRLHEVLSDTGKTISLIEMDNFLTDREEREIKGIFTQGKEALHFDLLLENLNDISKRKKISIPRYDFIFATSSHDNNGNLKTDGVPIEIEPADIIFIEGNFPFLIKEIADFIDIKVVYLTDDPVRLKRKWKRDIDLRKKYEPTYFRNRYFKDQFIMADYAYRPQLEMCDIAVDTTQASLWASQPIADLLKNGK